MTVLFFSFLDDFALADLADKADFFKTLIH